MTFETVLDTIGGSLIALGAFLGFVAAVGLLRLPDSLNRMHASSKPQSLGVVIICIGLSLILRDPAAWSMLAVVSMMQLLTTPTASQMISRSVFRTRQYRRELQVVDESGDEAEETEHRGI